MHMIQLLNQWRFQCTKEILSCKNHFTDKVESNKA